MHIFSQCGETLRVKHVSITKTLNIYVLIKKKNFLAQYEHLGGSSQVHPSQTAHVLDSHDLITNRF